MAQAETSALGDIYDRVHKILVDHLGVEFSLITPDAKLEDDLGADSLDAIELLIVLEEEFGIEIADDAAEKCVTVSDVVAYLRAEAA